MPCCGECNSIASDHVFKTLRAKRSYIQDRLRKKYAKLINGPRWSDEEIAELGSTLRSHILRCRQVQELTIARIHYRGPLH